MNKEEQREKTPYDHRSIESKWQTEWEKQNLYRVEDSAPGKKNFYTLVEFAYPSGNLHVGHWYAFSVPDMYARYKRMRGFNVLYPMGFDAFGLPAENAAIKNKLDPKTWTYENMKHMREQLRSMGASFDWSREVVTCDPEYYAWTQWMFNKFLEKDLVYRATTQVNWCPKDQTVLANEQVIDGKCDRCGSDVIQKNQDQWMFRITKYADRLTDDLDSLDWPEHIKEAQRNWIGRSEGAQIGFRIQDSGFKKEIGNIKVFTTRPDTLFGVTYIVLAPEHALVSTLKKTISNASEVETYIAETKKKSDLDRQQSKEKTGVRLVGVEAVNPANGESVPVFIADYVLAGYGTGAVMAVPAHDERDFAFAKKYDLPIREVIIPTRVDTMYPPIPGKRSAPRKNIHAIVRNPKTGKIILLKWKQYPWTTLVVGGADDSEDVEKAARREIREETGYKNLKLVQVLGGMVRGEYYASHKDENRIAYTTALVFDLLDEEQDPLSEEEAAKHEIFWGDISMVKPCAEIDVWMDRLKNGIRAYTGPGELVNSGQFSGRTSEDAKKAITEQVGGKVMKTYRLRDWGISRQRYWGVPIPIVYDPSGKAHPVPDKHLPWLLPTDVDHTPDGTAPLARSKELLKRTEDIFGKGWKPEVETMDTFVDSSWYFYRYLDPKNAKEFASDKARKAWMPISMYFGGAEHTTMHLLYSRFWVKAMFDLGLVDESEAYVGRRNRGLILGPDGNKMSKSKGNVIDPDEVVRRLGADTVRLYLAFMGPYADGGNYPWDPNGVVGVRRFLERVWKLAGKAGGAESSLAAKRALHGALKKIGEDIESFKFNTCVSQMMILLNAWEKEPALARKDFETFLVVLAPFAPHIAEELWMSLGNVASVHLSNWPSYDPKLLVEENMTLAVQVNGKVRATIVLPKEASQEEVEAKAKAHPDIKKWLENKEIRKVIVVGGKVVNIVL